MLEDQGALEITWTVQSRGQSEMPFEQRADWRKRSSTDSAVTEDISAEYTFCSVRTSGQGHPS